MSERNEYTLAFTGNPNCGKSTLFNALTGARQQIGNWPGVTVELVKGLYEYSGSRFNIVDLPGIYSLSPNTEDEKVSRDYVLSGRADLIINIIDATNLARNLYLTAQLIEMRVPVIVVLNMMDLAEAGGYEIDIEHLEAHLKCPVIGLSAVRQKDINGFKSFLLEKLAEPAVSPARIKYPNEIEELAGLWSGILEKKAAEMRIDPFWMSLRLIEEDEWITETVLVSGLISRDELDSEIQRISGILAETPDMVIADYVYGAVNGITREVVHRIKTVRSVSERIDSFAMHPVLGVPVFFAVMMLVFLVTIEIGNIFVDWFDRIAGFVFVDGLRTLIGLTGAPEWVSFFTADGFGAGLQMVFSFIPFVFFMFFMLSLLEDSGYMARAAFVMDRFMEKLGLPGKAFVPMIVGFGCTVPAILATRTLDNRRDRIMTIFMIPMMSCGARLPVYALFAAAFFPKSTGLIVFSLYMAGILVAVLSGLLIKSGIYHGEPSHLIMELPRYHVPRLKHILLHTWARVRDFINRAGRVIIIAVFILSILSALSLSGGFNPDGGSDSVLAVLGKIVTPLFIPMGIEADNWPATVGLFTGIFAKESIVGTLNALYSQIEPGGERLTGLLLLKRYFTPESAYAYLLFVLIYMPCIAAVSAAMKEISVLFGLLQAVYLTVLAWIVSTLFFQIVSGRNPAYILIAGGMLFFIVLFFRLAGRRRR